MMRCITVPPGVCVAAHSTILTLLPDYAIQQPGVSTNQAAMLLSIIGATNTAARVLAGWISDMPKVNCIWVNVAALFIGGAICVAVAFTHMYPLLAVEAGVFGLCMGETTLLCLWISQLSELFFHYSLVSDSSW